MAEHTPGPWSFEDRMEGGMIRADDPNRPGKRFLVCKIGPTHRSHADAQMALANSYLIAAAPELLEACKLAVFRPENPAPGDLVRLSAQTRDALNAAIAKAEGR